MQSHYTLLWMVQYISTGIRIKEMRKQIIAERNRLIQKMITEGKS